MRGGGMRVERSTMNVLSLFNGMGTLRQAMHNLNIEVNNYYSSEIKPYAIKLQQHHFPDVVQVGNINNWKQWDIEWGKIDFIGSGSPCQDLSACGKRAGITGKKSSLFFVFIEILEHVKKLNPNVLFFQENVGSAPLLDVGIMSRKMGVYPVRINSSLLTAQMRDRYYWTNIKTKKNLIGETIVDIEQPQDKNVMLQDVLESGNAMYSKSTCILESQGGALSSNKNQASLLKRAKKRFIEAVQDDNGYRILTKTELCRLQGFTPDYCNILSYQHAGSLLGDGWTLPIIEYILKHLALSPRLKSPSSKIK